jgi:hypothetical protein
MATMAALMNKPLPQIETPDPAKVDKIFFEHPAIQCRLDTNFQGSICNATFDSSIIPGKAVPQGPDSIEAEQEAAKNSCMATTGYTWGLRPTCWFKARL